MTPRCIPTRAVSMQTHQDSLSNPAHRDRKPSTTPGPGGHHALLHVVSRTGLHRDRVGWFALFPGGWRLTLGASQPRSGTRVRRAGYRQMLAAVERGDQPITSGPERDP